MPQKTKQKNQVAQKIFIQFFSRPSQKLSGFRQVPEGSGEQGKTEKTGCKIICGAPTTLAVKGLMMMIMTLLRCPYTPVCNRIRFSPCQSLVDYGNTRTPSMHRRLGSTTLSQQAFPREGKLNFPWEKPHWDNPVVKGI